MQIGTRFRQTNQLMRSDPAPAGKGSGGVYLTDVSAQAGPGFTTPRSHRAGGSFDFDRDGDLDLILTVIDESALLLRNDAGSRLGHWSSIDLAGTGANRSGAGARVTLTAGGRRQVRHASGSGSFLWSCDPRAHFGLGEARTIESLEVVWPGGRKQEFRNPPADTELLIVEGRPDPIVVKKGRPRGER